MTKPVTILAFLRHRIDRDEWDARRYGADEAGHSVARAVREATVKRVVVSDFVARVDRILDSQDLVCLDDVPGYRAIQYLAAVYADHPDYQEAWRP